jgi:hypothetical protein
MKWMNVKMGALGVLSSDNFKVTFMLDYRAMLTVHNERYGAALPCDQAVSMQTENLSLHRVSP